jgi:UDP-2,4-diacetamido-2,4,6-trideoxy-beta-L-altropyranose hydrolase
MNIMIRADASLNIGSGHVMRCLAFSEALRDAENRVSFICRELKGNLSNLIEKTGFEVHRLFHDEYNRDSQNVDLQNDKMKIDAEQSIALLKEMQNIDCLIVDHYSLDKQWEVQMRPYVKKIMVIDDLADRNHECDLLLDQNYYENMESRYKDLVADHCRQLLGPKYALLRKEFTETRKKLRKRNGELKKIMVFFGGSDLSNETSKVLQAIQALKRSDISVDVVIGFNNPHRSEIDAITKRMPETHSYCGVNNMAELMDSADVYVGAAGITTWERCCLGLPSLVITVAQNQVQATRDLANLDLLDYIGEGGSVSKNDLMSILEKYITNQDELEHYSKKSLKLVDGLGAQRCVDIMANC